MTSNGVLMPPADPVRQLLDAFDADGPTPDSDIPALLKEGWPSGHRKTMLTVARIRRDADLLKQWLTLTGREAAARQRLEDARAQTAAAEANLRAVRAGAPNKARPVVDVDAAGRAATTAQIREWLRKHGHDVGGRGRLTANQIGIYEAARQGGAE